MPFVIPAVVALWATLSTTTILGITLSSLVVNIAIGVGLSLISSLIAGGPKKPNLHASRENIRNPVASARKYYGRVKPGGVITFLKIAPGYFDGSTVNALYIIVTMSRGRFDAFEEHWLSDGPAILADDHVVLSPKNFYWSQLPFVRLYFHVGSETQSADVLMQEGFPGIWTTDFHGYGIAYAVLRMFSPKLENFNDVFPSGLPVYSAVVRAAILWDPRDPNQSHTSPASWKWKSNGVLCVLDALWNENGVRLPIAMLVAGIDVWKAEADYADTWRSLNNGGSEPWFRLAGGYELTDPPKVWLPKMLDPMDARLSLRGDGAVVIDTGRWRDPELTIPNDQILSFTGFSRGKQKADIRNVIDATFIAPEYDYVQQQADTWLNEASIDVDGEQQVTLDLDFAPSHAQARVRQKIEAYRQDPNGWCGTIITKAYGLKFLTPNADGSRKRFVYFLIDELGIDNTIAFEVQRFAFAHLSGQCTFTVSAMSADAFAWNPATDEGTPPAFPRTTAANDVENPFNLAVSVAGNVISATLDAPLQTGLNLDLAVRTTFDGQGDGDVTWVPLSHSGWGGSTGSLADGRYDIRARFYNTESPPDYSDPRVIRGIRIGTGTPGGFPAPPPAFNVTNCGGNTVEITLTAITAMEAVSVNIYMAPSFSSTFAAAALIASFPCISGANLDQFFDTGAAGHQNFWATTVDIFGNESATQIGPVPVNITAGTFAPPHPVPSAPAGLSAVPSSSNIALSWTANPLGDAVTAYQVWGSEGDFGFSATSLLATTAATTATLTGLDPESGYSLYLVAVNANGASDPSDVLKVTTASLGAYRAITAVESPLFLLDTDTWVDVTNATGTPLEIRMPPHPVVGQSMKITDAGATFDFTIKDHAGTAVIDTMQTAGGFHRSGWTGALWKLG